MSPFKVIRCRYYTEEGKAVPPYCSAGRHCTFLHPNDKGWPGGDPLPEVDKRPEERERAFDRSRPRFSKAPDRRSSMSHERRLSRTGPSTTSMLDLCSSEDPAPRKTSSYSLKDMSPSVDSIVKSSHDIAKFLTKLTLDREALDKTTEKFASFHELSKSLSKVSAVSAAVVAPTLDAIVNTRQDLQKKVDDDVMHISNCWEGVFDVFHRAICRQFDNELESGTEYLRQEARILLKSFPRNTDSYRHPEGDFLMRSSSRSRSKSHVMEPRVDNGDADRTSKESAPSESRVEANTAVINPPVGTSDNGWSRKRRRVSLVDMDQDGLQIENVMWTRLTNAVEGLQKQVDEQDKKVAGLLRRNEELESTVRHCAKFVAAHTSDSSGNQMKFAASPISEAQLSQIRIILREEVLALVSPSFEEQRKVNESWEARLSSLSAKLQEISMGRRTVVEDFPMEPTNDSTVKIEHD